MPHHEVDRVSVLILEDDVTLLSGLERHLTRLGWDVDTATTQASAEERIQERSYNLLLLDYSLPDGDGVSFAAKACRNSPLTRIILMSGLMDLDAASLAMRAGVVDLVVKPFTIEQLEKRIRQVMEQEYLVPARVSPARLIYPEAIGSIVGESPGMLEVGQLISTVASRAASVMILGESGTGKDLTARAIHDLSPRAKGPFVALNCAAIPEHLLEAELFGHVKGAFTDARTSRTGLLAAADGGTLFLDEIGDMPKSLQAKLLRVLETREFQPVGSNHSVQSDFRIITATNANLDEKIQSGKFRADLFYRLNVFPITLPPLRDRKQDIPILAQFFLDREAREMNEAQKLVSPDALSLLQSYAWPGNIRELFNVLQRAVILAGLNRVLEEKHFPGIDAGLRHGGDELGLQDVVDLPDEGLDLNRVVSEVEKRLILQSLEKSGGNKGKAARLLSLKRTTLVEKLRRLNLLISESE